MPRRASMRSTARLIADGVSASLRAAAEKLPCVATTEKTSSSRARSLEFNAIFAFHAQMFRVCTGYIRGGWLVYLCFAQ